MKKQSIRNITAIMLILSIALTQLGVIIHTHCCPESESLSEKECCSIIVSSVTEECCTTQTDESIKKRSNCDEHCYEACYIGNDYIKLNLDQIVKEKEEFKVYFVLIAEIKDYNNNDQDIINKSHILKKDDLPHHPWGENLIIYLHKEKTPDHLLIA